MKNGTQNLTDIDTLMSWITPDTRIDKILETLSNRPSHGIRWFHSSVKGGTIYTK